MPYCEARLWFLFRPRRGSNHVAILPIILIDMSEVFEK
jgi:hypothetical protein